MRKTCVVMAALPAMLLSACGGGSTGGGSVATSPPPPAPAPTNSTMTNLTVSETFQTASGSTSGNINAITGIPSGFTSAQSAFGSGVTVAYNASSDSYTVQVNQAGITASSTFGPAQFNTVDSDQYVDIYDRDIGDESQQFLLYRGESSGFTLTYVTFGYWLRGRPASGSSLDLATSFFVAGIRTAATSMPSTGTASYEVGAVGLWTDSLEVDILQGTATLSANFGTGSLSGTFDMSGVPVLAGGLRPFDLVSASASISGNTFSGSMNGLSSGYTGTWSGGFFGPNAAEIGGSFRLTNSFGGQAVGAFAGAQ